MKICVFVKQVPENNQVEIDLKTGNLIRDGKNKRLNPYDLYSVETALQLKERYGGEITAITMGPSFAEEALRQCIAMGVDKAVLLCDPAFGGADVIATSKTLFEGVKILDYFDIYLFGRQTTDGDTAQVGGSVSERLKVPFFPYVDLISLEGNKCSLSFHTTYGKSQVVTQLPIAISVEPKSVVPRIPTLKNKMISKKTEIKLFDLLSLEDKDRSHYGFLGSKTKVKKTFVPIVEKHSEVVQGSIEAKVDFILQAIKKVKIGE